MKFLELQIYNSENYKYEIMRIPIMVYESRIKGQGTTGAQIRMFKCYNTLDLQIYFLITGLRLELH